eukprot:gnl/TRDRNA2_/TRDRNA2_184972_c0_seq1.p1 gnl/TRDRNA2_/TRDRNA2_184972_c0~~gnl/TRDRNA2_/TRDRNA2_184972_c0_seq1.p1  ORF type:complete len:404 (+),score=50.58 gnl/TRDRNA2_/TRDRNA2_184972_c0_seq1:130-1341(+)
MDPGRNAANEEEGRAGETRQLREQDLGEFADKFELSEIRRRVAADPMLPSSTFTEWENTPAWMVPFTIVSAILQVTVVSGAHFFMIAYGRHIAPRCSRAGYRQWEEHLCEFTTLCFWTYPVVCPLVVVFIFWKNLQDKRLFYECLLNKIFLQFRDLPFFSSPTFWFLMGYGWCALWCLYFIKDTEMKNVSYTELCFGLLAYFTPIVAFLVVLFSTWSVNWHIVTLPKYVQEDRRAAVKLLDECTYVASIDFGVAFEAVECLYEKLKQRQKFTPQLTTSELVQLTLEMHQKGIRGTNYWSRFKCDCFSCCCCWWWFSRKYWASRFLYFEHLNDNRSWEFRRWCRAYIIFICFAVFVFIWAFLYTLLAFTVFEGERMPKGIGPHEVLPEVARDMADDFLPENVTS